MQGTRYSFFVQWHLTEKCNLRCRHCYQGEAMPEMSHDEIFRALDNIKEAIDSWGQEYGLEIAPSFHFTGGEPVLSDQLLPVLEYCRRHDIATSLMSNGTFITPSLAGSLAGAGLGDVQVSLDGLEDVHDGIRGRGAFRRALEGLDNLIARGIDTSINLTLSRINVDQIGGLVRLAGERGIGAVTLARLVVCGRGRELEDQMLTPAELTDCYREVRRLDAAGAVRVSSLDPLFIVAGLEDEVPDVDFPVGGCAAGVFGVTITADGGIMPCRRMDLTVGNIRHVSFRRLWAESPVLWSLRNREDYHGNCRSCRYWAVCRGCRAIALARARSEGREDYLGPDPQCGFFSAR